MSDVLLSFPGKDIYVFVSSSESLNIYIVDFILFFFFFWMVLRLELRNLSLLGFVLPLELHTYFYNNTNSVFYCLTYEYFNVIMVDRVILS
jgi:hypothetical protein